MKRKCLAITILIVLLYVAIILNQTSILGLGEIFGYIFYVLIIAGIVAAIWFLIKHPRKGTS